MAYLHLQPQVSFGLIGDRPVFLDIRRDRYLGLDPAAALAFERILTCGGSPVADVLAGRLLATGLFAAADRPRPVLPAQALPPTKGPDPDEPPHGGLILDLPAVWSHLLRVRHELRSRPLERIVRAREHRDPGRLVDDANRAAALAARFRRARRIVPIAPRCLPDTLALADWLAVQGVRTSLVFGVKLDPFAAHCWAQNGTTVLNEAPDKAAEFTPVLVIP